MHVELLLSWVHSLLLRHRAVVSAELSTYLPLLRRVGRVIGRVRGEVGRVSEENLYLLHAILNAAAEPQQPPQGQQDTAEAAEDTQLAKLEAPHAASPPSTSDDGSATSHSLRPLTKGRAASKRRKPTVNHAVSSSEGKG